MAASGAILALLFWFCLGSGSLFTPEAAVVAMQRSRTHPGAVAGTPVAAPVDAGDPGAGAQTGDDPLDGDPLDGAVAEKDSAAPSEQTLLAIERSGRPTEEPRTFSAYDDDPGTVWIPRSDTGETWIWLDLGQEQRLREVRWLAQGAGVVTLSVSSDLRRWRDVESIDVNEAWQRVDLRDDARFVRLALVADEGAPPAIAEVAIYGSARAVSSEQEANDTSRGRTRERNARDEAGVRQLQNAGNAEVSRRRNGNSQGETRSSGQVRITAQAGEARCEGDRERCQARQGVVTVEEDCGRGESCAIDIRADGGSALCDGSGGGENRAGGGRGRRAGDGGRCDAEADGGAVAVGDVNP
ncbi:MAG: discoidin domain-containing protein [Chloroflexia bacterium]|nr:discoidin domain-containing protein [Chloroflexia bacterium]